MYDYIFARITKKNKTFRENVLQSLLIQICFNILNYVFYTFRQITEM